MSRFLPAIRVAQILQQYGLSTHKELEEKLPKVVEAGQKRLIELQQPDGGWGWQGNGQTHEMMTPYALFGLIAAEEAGYPCPNPNTIPTGMTRLQAVPRQMRQKWDDDRRMALEQGRRHECDQRRAVLPVGCRRHERPPNDAHRRWWDRIEKTIGTDCDVRLRPRPRAGTGRQARARRTSPTSSPPNSASGPRRSATTSTGRRPGSRAGATTPSRSPRW